MAASQDIAPTGYCPCDGRVALVFPSFIFKPAKHRHTKQHGLSCTAGANKLSDLALLLRGLRSCRGRIPPDRARRKGGRRQRLWCWLQIWGRCSMVQVPAKDQANLSKARLLQLVCVSYSSSSEVCFGTDELAGRGVPMLARA